MISIRYTKQFKKNAGKLPRPQQEKLADCLEFLTDDPYHPKLHSKPLTGTYTGYHSFRITRDWRVIFRFVTARDIHLVDVAHRKDIYR